MFDREIYYSGYRARVDSGLHQQNFGSLEEYCKHSSYPPYVFLQGMNELLALVSSI